MGNTIRQINLLPDSVQNTERAKILKVSLSLTIVPALVMVLLLHGIIFWKWSQMKIASEQPPSMIETAETSHLRQRIKTLHADIKGIYERQSILIDMSLRRYATPILLKVMGKAIEHKAWLTNFSLDYQTKICQIEGRSFNTRLVSEFMLELKKIPYFKTLELISMEKGLEDKVNFKITCKLK